MIKICVLLCLLSSSALSLAHGGHDDALLMLIKYKLDLKTLQEQFPAAAATEQTTNLQAQARLLNHAMQYLQGYVAIAENRYPDNATYASSLQSRAALLQDYQLLLSTHLQQIGVVKSPAQ